MKIKKILFIVLFTTSAFFIGCKPKDSDIQASIEDKLKATTEITNPVSVSVNDGVATISGEAKDEASKAKAGEVAQGVKGVKSVTNNITVIAPPPTPAPVVINSDDELTTGAKQAVASYNGVTADVSGGVVTLKGSIKRSDLTKLMQSLNALHPKSIKNQLQIK